MCSPYTRYSYRYISTGLVPWKVTARLLQQRPPCKRVVVLHFSIRGCSQQNACTKSLQQTFLPPARTCLLCRRHYIWQLLPHVCSRRAKGAAPRMQRPVVVGGCSWQLCSFWLFYVPSWDASLCEGRLSCTMFLDTRVLLFSFRLFLAKLKPSFNHVAVLAFSKMKVLRMQQ